MQHKPHRLRVIGIGSNHGVDQVGWLACEMLQKKMKAYPIDWQFCRTPAQLPELFEHCDNAVLIDALISNKPIGQVLTLSKDDLLSLSSPWSSHGIGVVEALKLTEALGRLPANYKILGITTSDSEMKTENIALTALPQLEQSLMNSISNSP